MFAVPSPKKRPKVGVKKKVQFILPPPKKVVEKKPPEGRKYSQIAPESVKIKAECMGIDDLSDGVAKALSEEISYRLREIISKCTIYMRQSKRFKLTKPILKTVFAANDLDYDFGNLSNPIFALIEEEDLFVLNDEVMDIDQLTDEFLEGNIEIDTPKITGRVVLPDKKQKLPAPNKKTGNETETSEAKTEPVQKESTSEPKNNNNTIEAEPLEALGLRKVTKP